VAVAALVVSGLTVAPTASSMAAEPRSDASVKCKPGSEHSSDARVPHGVTIKRDPNTLTQARVARMEGRATRLLNSRGISPVARANGSVTVPTHVHVLVRNNGSGNVVNWRIRRQIAVLNAAFSGSTHPDAVNTPFRFRLDSIDRTRNTDWYNMDSEDSLAARRALRVGDARHLNLYVTNFAGDLEGLLGFATFPQSYSRTPNLDGAVLWNRSLPGGDAVFTDEDGNTFDYSRGDTGTHEVGHWMNLYHTFQGSCGPNNDYVADTPPQKADENVFLCDPALNTCGGPRTAKDPVRNFMNYVDDRCMDRFSWGQRDRMNISWYIRRALSN
jgi:hypothetical protein